MIPGKAVAQRSKTLVVRIPQHIAEALELEDGDDIDIEFFNDTKDFEDTYGDELRFIAITK